MAPKQSQREPATTGSVSFYFLISFFIDFEGLNHFFNFEYNCWTQVKTAMTMTEKIMARASERPQLNPGENVWVNVDILMTHDICGPGSIGIFKREFGENAKVLPPFYLFWLSIKLNWLGGKLLVI